MISRNFEIDNGIFDKKFYIWTKVGIPINLVLITDNKMFN